MLMEKAEHILLTNTPPDNYIPETDYRIRSFMSVKERAAYLSRSLPDKIHCRSCRFASVDVKKGDAHWHCLQHDKKIDEERQTKGCPRHNYIPELIPATVIEVDDNFVIYERDEFRFINVAEKKQSKEDNLYSSQELIEVINSGFPKELLEQCAAAKRLMNGTIKSIRPWVETGTPF
jgi:hypothetical protein